MAPAGRGAPVLDVVGEGPLAAVEINGQALAAFHQCDRNMHGERGFFGAPLFISNHDDMRQTKQLDRGVQRGGYSKHWLQGRRLPTPSLARTTCSGEVARSAVDGKNIAETVFVPEGLHERGDNDQQAIARHEGAEARRAGGSVA
jgi:hypothetical protein